jgi:hypothetical protein
MQFNKTYKIKEYRINTDFGKDVLTCIQNIENLEVGECLKQVLNKYENKKPEIYIFGIMCSGKSTFWRKISNMPSYIVDEDAWERHGLQIYTTNRISIIKEGKSPAGGIGVGILIIRNLDKTAECFVKERTHFTEITFKTGETLPITFDVAKRALKEELENFRGLIKNSNNDIIIIENLG